MTDEKRIIDKLEIIHSLQIGTREMAMGISLEQEGR